MDSSVSVQNEKITTGSKAIDLLSPSSWSRQRSQKSFTPTITWNLANPVNNHLGIIVRLHLIVLTNGIAERAVRRIKEATYAVLLQTDVDENWWDGSMECVAAVCETFKTSCLMGIHFMRGGSVNHSKDQSFRLVRWSNITRCLPKASQDFTTFGNQVLPRKFLGYAVYAEGIWEGDT